ncbi:MAG: hypothetical protein EON93_01125 [Burkholderiales bacterium]|nr:MAG: hypothetical protein EON93_01125 [Burkholderiales bacterium]
MARASGKKTKATAEQLAALQQAAIDALAPFLKDNPPASVEVSETAVRVVEPWGDNSLAFDLRPDFAELAEALNAIRLPKRLSALWHKDTQDLEVIWTAYKLPKSQQEIDGRKFVFNYKGKTYNCSFELSSDRTKTLGSNMIALSNSPTSFRNLQEFRTYANIPEDMRSRYGYDAPRSFWIRNVKFDDEYITELVTNLNFYLTYYDDRCPQVLVHEPREPDAITQRTRYVAGSFPEEIESADLDSTLLSFWNSADRTPDPMMRFLLYFRIIEYATTHYIDGAIKAELRKILLSPNLRSNIPSSLEKIVSSLTLSKIEDTQRFKALIRQCVDPKLIWRDVRANQAFFSKDTKFDGGFTVKALVHADDKEQTFCTRGLDSFSDSVRKIRNALSHGKDQETAGVITPSTRNLKLFQPWVHLIATAAGEVVLYKDAT